MSYNRSFLLAAGSDIVEVPDEYLDKVGGGLFSGTKDTQFIIDDRKDGDPNNDCIRTNTRESNGGFDQSWNDDYP